jgi:hypothetical protein
MGAMASARAVHLVRSILTIRIVEAPVATTMLSLVSQAIQPRLSILWLGPATEGLKSAASITAMSAGNILDDALGIVSTNVENGVAPRWLASACGPRAAATRR